jgi:cytochrome P450 family 628
MVTLLLVALSALLGIVSHWGYFVWGEHVLDAPAIFLAALLVPQILTSVFWFASRSFPHAITLATALCLPYVGALFSSIAIYRAFFHTLNRFPGPFAARLSKLWHFYKISAALDNYKYLDKLHVQYGEVVRTGKGLLGELQSANNTAYLSPELGPNEVSIADPAGVEIVHGSRSRCSKAAWYDATSKPYTTILQMRDRAMHDRRRRGGWDKAFGMKCEVLCFHPAGPAG